MVYDIRRVFRIYKNLLSYFMEKESHFQKETMELPQDGNLSLAIEFESAVWF